MSGEPHELPAYRRLHRDRPVLIMDDEGNPTPVLSDAPLPLNRAEGAGADEELFPRPSPAPSPRRPLPQFEPDPEIMLRFPTPHDTFSPSPSPPPQPADRPLVESTTLVKPKMKFVYPPIPRTPPTRDDDAKGRERAFSPGDCWLRKMLHDLERERKELCDDLEDAKREVSEALTEVTKADLACKEEIAQTQGFVKQLQNVVGADFIQSLIASIEEDDKEENANKDDADGEDADEDVSDEEGEEFNADLDDEASYGDLENTRRTVSLTPPASNAHADASPTEAFDCDGASERGADVFLPEDHEAEDDNPFASAPTSSIPSTARFSDVQTREPIPTSRSSSPPKRSLRASNKRARTPDDLATDDNSVRPKRSKLSHDASSNNRDRSLLPITTSPVHSAPAASPSSSRKRARDDDNDDNASEEEVEISIRALGPASSSSRIWKRQRSGDSHFAHDSGSAPIMLNQPLKLTAASLGEGGEDWGSGGSDVEQAYEDEDEDEEQDLEQDGTMISFDDLKADEDDVDPENQQLSYRCREMVRCRPEDAKDGALVVAADDDEAELALWKRRELKRDMQRIRETAAGDVETFVYDEVPEYGERLVHHEKTLASWRKSRERKRK